MIKRSHLVVAFSSFLLIGCTDSNGSTTDHQEEIEKLTTEISELNQKIAAFEMSVEASEEFSYLKEFTDQDHHNYRLFLKDRNPSYMNDFSPEKMVLLYFHSVTIDDLETIHAITYDGGTLGNYSQFKEEFYASDLSHYENESILDFRYYDEIKLSEQEETEDIVSVEISVSYGSFQSVRFLELQKENNQWKLVLQHLL